MLVCVWCGYMVGYLIDVFVLLVFVCGMLCKLCVGVMVFMFDGGWFIFLLENVFVGFDLGDDVEVCWFVVE